MTKSIILMLVAAGIFVTNCLFAQGNWGTTQTKPTAAQLRNIIYNEGGSLRAYPTSTVPSDQTYPDGSQGAPNNEAEATQKGLAKDSEKVRLFQLIALVVLCRWYYNEGYGHGRDTATAATPSEEELKNPGAQSSMNMATQAANSVLNYWDNHMTQQRKIEVCENFLHYFMNFYQFHSDGDGDPVQDPPTGNAPSPKDGTPDWAKNQPTSTYPPKDPNRPQDKKDKEPDGGKYFWDYSSKNWVKVRFPRITHRSSRNRE